MPDLADLGDPCARVFNEPSGPRAPGEACATAAACAGSPGTITMCISICVRYAVGADGDSPCLGNVGTSGFTSGGTTTNNSNVPVSQGFLCPMRAGLYCDLNDNHCKVQRPAGAVCTNTSPDFCPLPGLGDACTLDCAGDSYCDNVCKPKLATGATCLDSVWCSGDCAGSDLCSGTCVEGVCSPLTPAQELLMGVWCGTNPVSG